MTFAWLAALYVALNALSGARLNGQVHALALGVLFLATPVAASICRRASSPFSRMGLVALGGLACMLIWTALAIAHFHLTGEDQQRPSVAIVARSSVMAALLYLPVIVLGCGNIFDAQPDGDLRQASLERGNALGNAALWLLVAGAIAAVPAAVIDASPAWGPYSIWLGPVAGAICAINAMRAARFATPAARWLLGLIAAALLLRMAWIAAMLLLLGGWMH